MYGTRQAVSVWREEVDNVLRHLDMMSGALRHCNVPTARKRSRHEFRRQVGRGCRQQGNSNIEQNAVVERSGLE